MLLHFKEYQSYLAADPVDYEGIRRILTQVTDNLRAASKIKIYADTPKRQKALNSWFEWALERMEKLRDTRWTTKNARENFDAVKFTCRACHDAFDPTLK